MSRRGKPSPAASSSEDATPTAFDVVENNRRARFVNFIILGYSATDAAREAGYSEHTSRVQGSRLLTNAAIAAEITRRRKDLADAVQVKADMLIREHLGIALADPNDVVEVRRNCCRYCWGQGGQYQMTQREMDERRASYDRSVEEIERRFKSRKNAKGSDLQPVVPDFDDLGGVGFNKRRAPNAKCGECFGDGEEEVFVHDTRHVASSAKKLIRGFKRSKDGTVEVKLADQHAARIEAGKLAGLYVGKGEGPGTSDLLELLTAVHEGKV